MKKTLFYLCCTAALFSIAVLALWESPALFNFNNIALKVSSVPLTNKININTASLNELIMLDGIGEIRARAIIEYRENNGKFKDINEIKSVKGISDKTFNNIKEKIEV